MEIGKAFTFVNEDEAWIKKLAIGAVFVLFGVFLIPIMVVVGYQIRIIRNVIDGKDRPLPEWDEFGQLLVDGAVMFVAGFVYSLPIILISVCSAVVNASLFDGSADTEGIGIVATIALSCLSILYGLALAVIIPALYILYARTGELGSLFRFAEVIATARENLVDFIVVVLINLVANMVVGFAAILVAITLCGPFIVLLAGTAWVMFATAHLYGQIARKTSGKILTPDYSPA